MCSTAGLEITPLLPICVHLKSLDCLEVTETDCINLHRLGKQTRRANPPSRQIGFEVTTGKYSAPQAGACTCSKGHLQRETGFISRGNGYLRKRISEQRELMVLANVARVTIEHNGEHVTCIAYDKSRVSQL